MKVHTIGIIMNGVTGRMGTNQHLVRSILAIRQQGGVTLPNGDIIMPDPILVGRQEHKVKALAEKHGVTRWSTDLDACLADPANQVYFDSQTTVHRAESIKKAIAAGKDIYCEKPTDTSLEGSLELARLAKQAGVKNGVVQDKLFLPGLLKLKRLIDSGFFGKILSVRMEFGYWVFEGDWQPGQRPSWNYRKEDGGGIIVDMFAHWRYVLDNLFGNVKAISCLGMTHIPERVDEQGERYTATADDAAYATFLLEGDIVVQANSSWAVRVDRDDLLTIQVDGTEGSAVAGLRDCKVQHRVNTPKPVWNPDIENPFAFTEQWVDVPANQIFDNGFKVQWELFLKHLVIDTPFPWDLLEGAKGTQMSDLGLQSWKERQWVDVPDLKL
ncbi:MULTISPECIES: Gfo/Idh/MocA family protein [Paenibacillus]|jgi:predicted dehydrogenase|uniref:Gfo/Idh/MocA family oxidoreductase n=1 Tax=Paenibacillus baimaensis TaxID=2982185 RepID=A0ABT2UNK4_9BACL|nr:MULTISPECIES: Gfo/Idh/MocA family oxidoreductase [unclassified Paenibacillus]MCU6796231.1 Gfo/Idh/MocA family oxidoreductase [Paenibacillus sp. WQ 127069]OMF18753.1 oxidoreductase [Paenibacillus sp. FSL H7-0331]